jgi:hypothetical protein
VSRVLHISVGAQLPGFHSMFPVGGEYSRMIGSLNLLVARGRIRIGFGRGFLRARVRRTSTGVLRIGNPSSVCTGVAGFRFRERLAFLAGFGETLAALRGEFFGRLGLPLGCRGNSNRV